jgi:hypothetical protein
VLSLGVAAGNGGGVPLSSISAAHEELPFELRALEVALDTVGAHAATHHSLQLVFQPPRSTAPSWSLRRHYEGAPGRQSVKSGWLLALRWFTWVSPRPLAVSQVSHYLERLTGDLEAAAHPALDALTGKVRPASP